MCGFILTKIMIWLIFSTSLAKIAICEKKRKIYLCLKFNKCWKPSLTKKLSCCGRHLHKKDLAMIFFQGIFIEIFHKGKPCFSGVFCELGGPTRFPWWGFSVPPDAIYIFFCQKKLSKGLGPYTLRSIVDQPFIFSFMKKWTF